MEGNIIARKSEQSLIHNYYCSDKAELIAIYGRRRVGKTYLVKQMFDNKFDFQYTGMYQVSCKLQLLQFHKYLENYSKRNLPKPKSWFEAFDQLKAYLDTLKKDKIVVFLDEMPWMDTQKSNFLPAFSQFWNDWGSTKSNLKLFVCGSATTWMLSNFIGDKGGLYGRVCRPIYIAPFSLGETEDFLKSIKGMELNRKQILDIYMILGGIPYYLDMLVKGMPIDNNINQLFFSQNAPLRTEFDFLFRSLFKESQIYKNVITVLSTKMKGLSRKEIMEAVATTTGGALSTVLDNLVSCDFIRKYTIIGKKEKDALYQLTDLFSLFYLRFVEKGSGQDDEFWSKMRGTGRVNAWSGYAFEQVCLHHIKQIREAIGISGVVGNAHSWCCKPFIDKSGKHWDGGQIDLLIDRNDDVMNLIEMKFVSDKYVIDEAYEQKLRERASLFKTVTSTKKALHQTFITTYGVAENKYSGIVQSELTMDDLF